MSTAAAAAADTARDLYERHAPQVYSLCLRRLGSREEAEDAAQTVFLNAFGALRRGTRPRFERAWLHRIAENVCHDRRSRIHVTRDLHALEEVLASPEREPGALAGIEQALAALSEGQRRAIVLREWHGLSYREIAAELGLSEPAAEALAFRARRTLAERLRDSRANLSLLGWLKPVTAGSAAAAKVAAVGGVVAVGAGGAATYVVAGDGSSPARTTLIEPATHVGPAVSATRPTASLRLGARPASPGAATAATSEPTAPGLLPSAPGPAVTGSLPSTPGPAPSTGPIESRPSVDEKTSPPPSSTAPLPVELPLDLPALPLDVPELPIDVPELPVDVPEVAVEVPELPVDVPPLPPLDPPALPPLEPPALPEVEVPSLPGLP